MKNATMLAMLLSAAPFAAHADSITGGLTLSYTTHGNDFGDIQTRGLDGRLDVDMDNGLSFSFDIGNSTMTQDGVPFDFDAEFYSLEAAYSIGNGMRVGLFADRLTLGAGLAPIDIGLNTNGLLLGYDGNGYEVEAFYGATDLSVPLPVDIKNLGVTGKYTGMDGWVFGGTFLRATLSQGPMSADMDFVGAAATYMVTPSLMVFGGAGQLDMDMTDQGIDSFGLGVSYDLGDKMGFASSISAEIGRTSQGSADLEVIRVGWSIPLGKSGPVLPMNSVADAILNPRHGAFNAGITAGF